MAWIAAVAAGIVLLGGAPAAMAATTPTIDSLSQTVFSQGDPVAGTILGSNFEDGAVVTIQGVSFVTPTSLTPSSLTFAFAPGAVPPGTYNLAVRNPGSAPPSPFSDSVTITVTAAPGDPPVPFAMVNSTADPGDGTCAATECTLREAILAANAHPNAGGPDLIQFAIPGGSPWTIALTSSLPVLNEAVVIDGLTQTAQSCSGPGPVPIELVGSAGLGNGIDVAAAGTTIRGLAVGGFTGGAGIRVTGVSTVVECNNIGTDATGTQARPNGTGLDLQGSSFNTIRRNVIAHNANGGVFGGSNLTTGNSILDNGGPGLAAQGSSVYGNFSRALASDLAGLVDFRLNTGPGYAAAGTPFTYEIFASPSCDPSGFGEGATSVGSFPSTVGLSDGGRAVVNGLVGPVSANMVLTATLTNDSTGVTGPFGPCVVPGLRITSVLPAAEFEDDGNVPVYVSGEGFTSEMKLTVFLNDLPGLNPLQPVDLVYVSPTLATAVLTSQMQGFVTVTAVRPQAAGGGASAAFSFHIWPRLIGIAPAAAASGSPGTEVTITGNRFVVAGPGVAPSVVRVNGTDLPAANVNVQSPTQIAVTIPESLLTTVGTLQITVRNPASMPPAPSNVLPFFVTASPVPVESAAAATASAEEAVIVTASTDDQSATATTSSGTGTVAVANYGDVPAPTGTSFEAGGSYFDVFVAPGSSFSVADITLCTATAVDTLYWTADGDDWHPVPELIPVPATLPAIGTCFSFTVTADSTPSITDLAGTAFATAVNRPPSIAALEPPSSPLAVGGTARFQLTVADLDTADLHTVEVNWGDGTTTTYAPAVGPFAAAHVYAQAGVYTVQFTIDDGHGGAASATYQYVVVYDPSAGFVTGGGWITSPVGAYALEPALSGKATFGFVSQYKKGANVPTGNTEFQFNAGGLNFKSTSYDWLVVAGAKAQFKGTGTINGSGAFGFMLSATDGQAQGGGGTDTFRIKIWDKATEQVIYDNQIGADEDAEPSTALGGGSIVVHK